MLEAAERGALLRRRVWVHRVDFDDIAVAVRLVRMLGDIEALVRHGPAITPVLRADAVAGEAFGQGDRLLVLNLLGRREVAVEVLFAGQIGAPGRAAVAAVVPGAQ